MSGDSSGDRFLRFEGLFRRLTLYADQAPSDLPSRDQWRIGGEIRCGGSSVEGISTSRVSDLLECRLRSAVIYAYSLTVVAVGCACFIFSPERATTAVLLMLSGWPVVLAIDVLVATRPKRRRRRFLRTEPCPIDCLLKTTPARAIGIARPIDVTIEFSASPGVTPRRLKAPFTGRTCVAYIAIVENEYATGRGSPGSVTIAREIRAVPFQLDDESGRALVDPKGAELEIELDAEGISLPERDVVSDAFLRRLHARIPRDPHLRFREGVINVGERVTLFVDGASVRRAGSTIHVTVGNARGRFVISDEKSATMVTVPEAHVVRT
jgi:hypothetical protein